MCTLLYMCVGGRESVRVCTVVRVRERECVHMCVYVQVYVQVYVCV